MSVIEENLTVQRFLEESEVLQRTGVVHLLLQEMSRPESAFDDVLAVVEQDTPLQHEILTAASSAKFGGCPKHCTLPEAFGRLGVDEFYRTLITSVIRLNLTTDTSPNFVRHADLLAKLCGTLTTKCSPDLELDGYLTGLCHDAAVPVMADSLEDYQYFVDQALSNDPSVLELEAECYEFNHCDAGAAIVESMALPTAISAAIRIHHEPHRLAELDGDAARLAAVLALSERIVQVATQDIAAVFLGSSEAALEEQFRNVLGVSHEGLLSMVDELVPLCAQRLRQRN